MQIGIGLPAGMPNTPGQVVLDWARRADQAGFYSLGIIDRIVYPNYEPMIALAAAAAVTQRARLITVILIATIRNAGILAKEAASIDLLSNGRLTLGLAVGGREDDFRAAPEPFEHRGTRFVEQVSLMRRVWAGQGVVEGDGPIGPKPVQPGGPPVIVGGSSPVALRRAGRIGEGYIAGTRDAPDIAVAFKTVEESWKAAGKSGRPRLVAIRYFALGPNAAERGAVNLRDYYSSPGQGPERAVQAMITTPERIKEHNKAFEDIGGDELVWLPTIAEVDQVDRLKDVVG